VKRTYKLSEIKKFLRKGDQVRKTSTNQIWVFQEFIPKTYRDPEQALFRHHGGGVVEALGSKTRVEINVEVKPWEEEDD
jgi:hypothetical protein